MKRAHFETKLKGSKPILNRIGQVGVTLGLAFLVGCGGSSNDGAADFEGEPSWSLNVFEDESNFKNFCENPRTGSDQNGNAFPDRNVVLAAILHCVRPVSDVTLTPVGRERPKLNTCWIEVSTLEA